MSELINQCALNLKRAQEKQGMETILASPEFYETLLKTIEKSRNCKTKWHIRAKAFGNE